jgi:hypothetical protein
MSQLGQRISMSKVTPKAIWKAGVALFIISFVTPVWRGGDDFAFFGGAAAFISVPAYIFQGLLPDMLSRGAPHVQKMDDVYKALVMSMAWIANIPIFFRLPTFAAVISIALPWLAYGLAFSDLVTFLPFYPWAIGITLIHLSKIYKGDGR